MNSQEAIPVEGRLAENYIDDFAHLIKAGLAPEGDPHFNSKIDVLRIGGEDDRSDIDNSLFRAGGRAQVWQLFAIDKFASNPTAREAAIVFGLAGKEAENKENWTQLLEHVSGVVANAMFIVSVLHKYGFDIDKNKVVSAALFDSLEKPAAIKEGIEMRTEREKIETAALVHDTEKSRELDGARLLAKGGNPAGLENSRDNMVIRDGRLWIYLHLLGVEDDVIVAAQNTGRTDRYFSDLASYDENGVKKALEDREKLASLLRVDREAIDAMTPSQRRQASIRKKGPIAAIIAIADAMSAQAKLQGMSEAVIDDMADFYTDKDRNPYAKTDPESKFFFGHDWPEYYKEVRAYLISLVPKNNRQAFAADLDAFTYKRVFNEIILPHTLGAYAMSVASERRERGEPNAYDILRYPDESLAA